MKKITYILFLTFLSTANYVSAQTTNPCACCSDNYKAFNFWIGDWTVYNKSGQIIGANKVVKMLDGCVLQENWVAANKTNTGTSYNFYNASDSTWNQVWVSNSGNVLNLKGNLSKEGVMILKSNLLTGPRGKYYNQITWSVNTDGSVTQLWDILNEAQKPISIAFEGIYKKNVN